jgi:hypothetical protein
MSCTVCQSLYIKMAREKVESTGWLQTGRGANCRGRAPRQQLDVQPAVAMPLRTPQNRSRMLRAKFEREFKPQKIKGDTSWQELLKSLNWWGRRR